MPVVGARVALTRLLMKGLEVTKNGQTAFTKQIGFKFRQITLSKKINTIPFP